LLADADGLWRAAALTGLPDAPFVGPESARLDALRLAALEDRIDADLELGRHADLVAELSALAARYPLQERLRGQLMLALYRSGRQAEALDVYRETRRLLADELGLDPSQSLRDLERAILAQDPALDAPPRQAKRTVVVAPAPGAASGQPQRRRMLIVAALIALGVVAAAGAFTAHALTEGQTEATGTTTSPATGSITKQVATTTRPLPPRRHRIKPTDRAPTHAATTTPHATTSTPLPAAATQPAPTTVTVAKTPVTPAVTTAAKPPPTTTTATTGTRTHPATTAAARPKPLRIADDFSSPSLDPTIWRQITDGTGSDVTQAGGQVSIAIAVDATTGGPDNAVGGRVQSQCTFPGDFDARVDFTLFAWPAADNVRAGLEAFFAGGFVARTSSASSGDAYSASVGSRSATVPLDETAGSLRIARVGKTMTTYFWRNGHWVPLASGPSSGAALLGLEVKGGSDFGGAGARAAFDNFAVTAPTMFCPSGSAPSGA
jgi:cytoskeletal protein RodZ